MSHCGSEIIIGFGAAQEKGHHRGHKYKCRVAARYIWGKKTVTGDIHNGGASKIGRHNAGGYGEDQPYRGVTTSNVGSYHPSLGYLR